MSDLTRREQRFLRLFGGYLLIRCVAHPGQHEAEFSRQRDGMSGGTTTLDDVRGSGQTTSKGLGWCPGIAGYNAKPEEFEVFVTWRRLSEHARSVTTPERTERIRDFLRRSMANQLDSPHWPGTWRGVPWAVPRNDRGWDREEHARWYAEVHHPEWRALQAERVALIEECLPLLTDDEPVDLLELLGLGG